MLADSGLLNDLERFAFSPAGTPICVYGDSAYPLGIHLQAPFRRAHLTLLMEAYNTAMNIVRTSLECIFGDIIKNLKIGLSTGGKMYVVCAVVRTSLETPGQLVEAGKSLNGRGIN